jgi:hypothetical protein
MDGIPDRHEPCTSALPWRHAEHAVMHRATLVNMTGGGMSRVFLARDT